MEQNLAIYIDRIDSTEDSNDLIIDIYDIIKDKPISPAAHQEICNELFEHYNSLCSLEARAAPVEEWRELYYNFRDLRRAVRDNTISVRLGNLRRTANLDIIDGILFYMKLVIVRPRERLLVPSRSIESLPNGDD